MQIDLARRPARRVAASAAWAAAMLAACSGETPTDPSLRSALVSADGLIPAAQAFARSGDIKFMCIGSGDVRPDDHVRALQKLGYFKEAPIGEPFETKASIGAFTYDVAVFSESDYQVYAINARDLGWPHASAGCYHGQGAQIGLMDTGAGLRVITAGRRVGERNYWRE